MNFLFAILIALSLSISAHAAEVVRTVKMPITVNLNETKDITAALGITPQDCGARLRAMTVKVSPSGPNFSTNLTVITNNGSGEKMYHQFSPTETSFTFVPSNTLYFCRGLNQIGLGNPYFSNKKPTPKYVDISEVTLYLVH